MIVMPKDAFVCVMNAICVMLCHLIGQLSALVKLYPAFEVEGLAH